MAMDLLGARLTALHDVPSVDAALIGARLTVLHDSPPASAALIGARLTVLHTLPPPVYGGARSLFRLTIRGEDEPPESAYSGKITTWTSAIKQMISGIGTDQITTVFRANSADDGALGTSATRAIDLKLALDPYGESLGLSDVSLLYVEHKAGSLASSISVQAAAADGFTNLFSATANATLSPGDFMLIGAFTAANLPVTLTNKIVDIINDDGAQVADYVVEVWGR